MRVVHFVVEGAGCSACATRVRTALVDVATVRQIEVDESSDTASVVLGAPFASEDEVSRALLEASVGAGHEYRVRSGSWRQETTTST